MRALFNWLWPSASYLLVYYYSFAFHLGGNKSFLFPRRKTRHFRCLQDREVLFFDNLSRFVTRSGRNQTFIVIVRYVLYYSQANILPSFYHSQYAHTHTHTHLLGLIVSSQGQTLKNRYRVHFSLVLMILVHLSCLGGTSAGKRCGKLPTHLTSLARKQPGPSVFAARLHPIHYMQHLAAQHIHVPAVCALLRWMR